MARGYSISADVQLPFPTAVWVLAAHLYALLVPLTLMAVVAEHWEFVATRTAFAVLLPAAAGIMMAGSAFEIAQNALDRWYLTRETASAEGTGFCDLMFYWCIVWSQALVAVACVGLTAWSALPAAISVIALPLLYGRGQAQFLPLAVAGLTAVASAYRSFADPVLVLQLALSPLTMLCFASMLKTGNQVLHGFTTLFASSGVLFLAAGVHGAAIGDPLSWVVVGLVVLITGVAMLALKPLLVRLPATPLPRWLPPGVLSGRSARLRLEVAAGL